MHRLIIALLILMYAPTLQQGRQLGFSQTEALESGKVHPHVLCAGRPDQSYALFLPSNYTASRRWPLVLSSDPGAHGTAPLELQKSAAERHGYVLAASNNSRNGPWQRRLEATDVVLADVQRRVAIDSQRVYLVGFSGGARFLSQVAFNCKCAAGVFLSGAGFFTPTVPNSDAPFPVFSAVGTDDFNYSEVIPLQDGLKGTGYPHWLRVFEGSHQWAPAEVMEEAFAWFRLQGMKAKREPPDANFIQEQYKKALARADSLPVGDDLLAVSRENVQIAASYEGLVDVASIGAKADALSKSKGVRDALKREQSEFQEQARLTSEITSHISAPDKNEGSFFLGDRESQQQLVRLRESAEHEKRTERSRVFKRALGGVFVFAMESGNALFEEKDYLGAIRAYDFATQALPESEWAWDRLAVAQASAGKKKDALASLKRGRDLSGDKSEFAKWLVSEPAFAAFRSTPELQGLAQ